jgi:hypothetical protein
MSSRAAISAVPQPATLSLRAASTRSARPRPGATARAGGRLAARTASAHKPSCLHTVAVLGQRGYPRIHRRAPAMGKPSSSALRGDHSYDSGVSPNVANQSRSAASMRFFVHVPGGDFRSRG